MTNLNIGVIPKTGGNKEIVPVGTHLCRIYGVIDMGTQTQNFKGNEKQLHMCRIEFETLEEFDSNNKPFTFWTDVNFLISDGSSKSNLTKILKAAEVDIQKDVSIFALINKLIYVDIKHNTGVDSKIYFKIEGYMPLPKKIKEAITNENSFAIFNEPRILWLGAGASIAGIDKNIEKLPPYLQEKIKATREYQLKAGLISASAEVTPKPTNNPSSTSFDDKDLPIIDLSYL
jgi:hypothetical protein